MTQSRVDKLGNSLRSTGKESMKSWECYTHTLEQHRNGSTLGSRKDRGDSLALGTESREQHGS